jgi:Mg2+ and Co2+ transporter CorA
MSARQYPKVEAYDGYLYVILHGIEYERRGSFSTNDVDFFLGRTTSSPCTAGIARRL